MMKKLTLFLILNCFFTIELVSQSLVEEGNKWNIVNYPTFSPDTTSYTLLIGEDTIVNNLVYNKVYYSLEKSNSNWKFHNEIIRQDSIKKVYLKRWGDEFLLYDFSLQLNDLFIAEDYCTLVVTKVDSVTLNNNEVRKRLQLEMQDNPNWGKQYWIDGIGSNFGMLSHFYYCFFDYNEGFLCFYNDSELLYPQTPPSCFITSDQEIEQNKIEVYPNPVSDNLSIICQGSKLTRFILTDLIGRTVHKGKLKEDENWIQVGHLQNGYYNILLGDEKVFKHSKKILKIEE